VSAEKQRRILTAIDELGYERDDTGRNLKLGRSAAIGLIVPDIVNPFFARVAEGVQEEAYARELTVVLCFTRSDPQREQHYAVLLRRRRLDGLIHLSGTGLPSCSLIGSVPNSAVVVVDERIPGSDLPFVGSDNRRGARAVAEYVLSEGHRRVGIVGGPRALWTAEQRLAGYREALAASGIDPESIPIEIGDYRIEGGATAAERLLAVSDRRECPTAILAANDLMALGVLQFCRRVGLRAPDDISLVGYDDVSWASIVTPGLTTVRQPAYEMGRVAARLLLDRLGGAQVPTQVELKGELVLRESVRKAKGGQPQSSGG
jgi:DNA-binding LacI/PurR family transcriptional regulator